MANVNIGNEWPRTMELSRTNRELFRIYRQHLPLLRKIVDSYLKRSKLSQAAVADFGGADGQITEYLKGGLVNASALHVTCIDTNRELLRQNHSADEVIAKALVQDLGESLYDIGIMRYVLNYNTKDDQQQILDRVYTAMKKNSTFINQWCGVFNAAHQKKFQTLFHTRTVNSKLYRPASHWATWDETEGMFHKAGFSLRLHKDYKLPIKDLYKIRYDLTNTENKAIHDFLGKDAYIYFTIFEALK